MDRRRFLVTSVAGALARPLPARAQQAGKVYRLGTLQLGMPPPSGTYDVRRDVVAVLYDMGYVKGRNLEVEQRYAGGRVERLPALAAELVQRHVDVIVASGSAAVRAAQEATKTIPISSSSLVKIRSSWGWFPAWPDPAGTSPVSYSEAYWRASDWNY